MAGRLLTTGYSTLRWSSDGRTVTKARTSSLDARRRFRNELRVNRLLVDVRPPVVTPRLLGHDRQHLRMCFTAIAGEVVGPKYPLDLADDDVDGLAALARALRPYDPRRGWLHRFDAVARMQLAARAGLVGREVTRRLLPLAAEANRRRRFQHGDLTARNVLRASDELVLIDWEWAGVYPDEYDLAFL